MEICIKHYNSDENMKNIIITVDYLVIGGKKKIVQRSL